MEIGKETFFFILLILQGVGRGEKHGSIVPLIYALIGCFLYVLLTGDRPCNLGILGQCSKHLTYPARVGKNIFQNTN